MDPQVEYVGEENKYGVAKSETQTEQDTTPVGTKTTTESRGLFGLGGKSDTSSSSESESEEGKERPTPADTAPVGTAVGTDYSVDSIEGGNPTGGTDFSATTALEGGQRPTGGTDYSGASVGGGNPTGGTDFSGADLGLPGSTNTTTAAPALEKKHHHLFGL